MNKKKARQMLAKLGITPDNDLYKPRDIVTSYKTIPVVKKDFGDMSETTDSFSSMRFEKVPIVHRINPYRQLLQAMVDGTYTEELRSRFEK